MTLPRPEQQDVDPLETQEWLEALDSVFKEEGPARAHYLIERLLDRARRSGLTIPYSATTAYLNTIPVAQEESCPGDAALEWRIRSLIRWNAMAMVVRANQEHPGLGGHVATFASVATLYDIGFNYFWRAPDEEHDGDLVFFQGHSAPGVYARAYLEGRLDKEHLHRFRREAEGGGLSSYPHPYLMPDFWQFPTVSMGLGPIQGIYQARFMKYLDHRGLLDAGDRKVWVFVGDGEMDEPESLGALSVAGRERLDNLVFVVNCNLQRLDGPVRGNGKIIQELEGVFRGAGWNVIKLIWGSYWDPLFARDTQGILLKRMEECVDGDFQTYSARDGAYVREHFFGKYPELEAMVANMADQDLWRLNRGGHDPHKVYTAYRAAVAHKGQPTVILAKTIKGYGMGTAGQGLNITHQQKKLDAEDLKAFRDRFKIPISDDEIKDRIPFYRPAEDSPEIRYLKARRKALGGYLPVRRDTAPPLRIPDGIFDKMHAGTDDHEISTTMALVRVLASLLRDPELGPRVVPIVPDESRTFGMEGMFRQLGIYAPFGQLYEPEDAGKLAYYREEKTGQVLEEGINEAGAMSSFVAAGTSYSTHGLQMIPFYIFYSMFGFQRVGDLIWSAGDLQARGFLIGGTAGRTTLPGEGLQHQDGHSHLAAAGIPNCYPYDVAYAYEVAVIVEDGLRRMYEQRENRFYYLTVENENYAHPPMPESAQEGILAGLHLIAEAQDADAPRVQLLGSGAILGEALAAAERLRAHGVESDVWSVTSFVLLARDGARVERHNRLHPESPQIPWVEQCLAEHPGPIIAASDYVRMHAEQIRSCLPAGRDYRVLGTDGFGRSDTREKLREFFEVNADHILHVAARASEASGQIDPATVQKIAAECAVDPDRPEPFAS